MRPSVGEFLSAPTANSSAGESPWMPLRVVLFWMDAATLLVAPVQRKVRPSFPFPWVATPKIWALSGSPTSGNPIRPWMWVVSLLSLEVMRGLGSQMVLVASWMYRYRADPPRKALPVVGLAQAAKRVVPSQVEVSNVKSASP